MGKQVTLEDDVIKALIERAVELDMVFSPLDEVLRVILNIPPKSDNYPSSKVPEVQSLLRGLKNTIFSFSKNGMKYHSKSRRWVAEPNTVTITVQDARSRNLRITVYGKQHEFEDVKSELGIEDDMAGYSRFIINNERQLPSAIKVIERSYDIKKERGRL